jgi:GNAT superfamily N-acetyltransferase
MREFGAEVERIHTVYNSAWEENWGAVAMTDREFAHLAKSLKQVIDPDLCLIAEANGEVAGFSLALPDVNQLLKRLDGRLLPFGIFKILYHKRKINAVRVLTMGVVKRFRNKGLDSCFIYETYRRAIPKGMGRGELSWVLENNVAMNRVLQNLGFVIYKKYRLYDFSLRSPY